MASVKFGVTVVGLRGTVGGVTFTAGAAGPYARQWAKGSNPRSALQLSNRAALTRYGAVWRSLGPSGRAAWTSFGLIAPEVVYNRLGEVVRLSGWLWFVKANQRLAGLGRAIETSPPSTSTVAAAAGFSLSLGELPGGSCSAGWTAGSAPSSTALVLELSLNTSGAAGVPGQNWVRVWSAYEPAGTSADITTEVGLRYGSIRAGWGFFGRLYVLRDDGVRSVAAAAAAVVV
jgi:hypothetical protein